MHCQDRGARVRHRCRTHAGPTAGHGSAGLGGPRRRLGATGYRAPNGESRRHRWLRRVTARPAPRVHDSTGDRQRRRPTPRAAARDRDGAVPGIRRRRQHARVHSHYRRVLAAERPGSGEAVAGVSDLRPRLHAAGNSPVDDDRRDHEPADHHGVHRFPLGRRCRLRPNSPRELRRDRCPHSGRLAAARRATGQEILVRPDVARQAVLAGLAGLFTGWSGA